VVDRQTGNCARERWYGSHDWRGLLALDERGWSEWTEKIHRAAYGARGSLFAAYPRVSPWAILVASLREAGRSFAALPGFHPGLFSKPRSGGRAVICRRLAQK
jgi:hypothetical protein